MSVKDSNPKAFATLAKRLADADRAYVTVGIHEDAGRYPGPDAPLVSEVAWWNEFGTSEIPERSFFRSTFTQKAADIEKIKKEELKKIMDGKSTVTKSLSVIGFRAQVMVQNKIKSNIPPPNAPSTKKAKAREYPANANRTLMASELLLRSVTFKVTK